MKYSYTLLANVISDPPRFESKEALKKHVSLTAKPEDLDMGILIDVVDDEGHLRSFKFDSLEQVNTFLSYE